MSGRRFEVSLMNAKPAAARALAASGALAIAALDVPRPSIR